MSVSAPIESESTRAWIVTFAAFAANFATFGILFSFGVYQTPLAETFGVETGPVSSLFALTVLVYYLSGAVGGRLGDRYGTRLVVAVGAITITVALYASAQVDELWQLYLVFPFAGIAVGACYPPLIGAIGQLFDRRRVLAIAIVLTGVGAGTWIMPPVAQALIDSRGWRSTFELWSVLTLVVLGATALTLRRRPTTVLSGASKEPPAAQLAVSGMTGSARFRWLYLAVVLVSPGFYAPLAFMKDRAVAEGVGDGAAAWLVGIIGGSTVAARLVIGALGPRFEGLHQYAFSYWVMTMGLSVWLVAGGSYPLLALAAALHGLGWAIWVTAAPLVLAEWFGVRDLGGALGAFYTGLGLGAVPGPALSGFIIDQVSYEAAIGLVVVLNVAAIGAVRVVRTRHNPAPQVSA